MTKTITNIVAYKFINLTDLEALQHKLYTDLTCCAVLGTILLAPEGINLMIAGNAIAIKEFREYMSKIPEFSDLTYKDTFSATIPFERFRVKVKQEIVPMGNPDIKPACFTGPEISAQELKQWLDEERDFILLDTRNDYEIELGTFEKAIDWDIHNFREFSDAADKVSEEDKQKPLVMFCTGGIRCEKASPLLIEKGFKDVYQLKGGIIKYFQEVGGAHYKGSCFIFDHRTAITPDCKETGLTQCEQCQQFVTAEEQAKTNYKRGDHCLHCMPQQVA